MTIAHGNYEYSTPPPPPLSCSYVRYTQAREKISRETFEQKLRHPLAAKMRKQIDEWMEAFREQDLRAMVAETQVQTSCVCLFVGGGGFRVRSFSIG